MKTLLPLSVLGLAFGWLAFQEEPPSWISGDIRPGNRVEVRLKNGHPFQGEVVAITPNSVTIDVKWEYADVTGTITFRKYMVRSVVRLEDLTAEQLLERIRAKVDAEERLARAAERNREVVAGWWQNRAAAATEAALIEQRREEEAGRARAQRNEQWDGLSREVYAKFPEPRWNESLYRFIGERIQLGDTGEVTAAHREFHEKFDLWRRGRELALQEAARRGEEAGGAVPPAAGTGTATEGTGGTATP